MVVHNLLLFKPLTMSSTMFLLFRELRGAARMQLIGHQVVGSKNVSHEEVKDMYRKLFKGESIEIKKMLKKEFGAIEGRAVLSQIFQVHSVLHNFHYTACNYLPGHRIERISYDKYGYTCM